MNKLLLDTLSVPNVSGEFFLHSIAVSSNYFPDYTLMNNYLIIMFFFFFFVAIVHTG